MTIICGQAVERTASHVFLLSFSIDAMMNPGNSESEISASAIRTSRLELLPLTPADSAEIFAANQGDVRERFANFADVDAAGAWVENAVEEASRGKKIEYVIRDGRGVFVGMVGVNDMDTTPELGLWISIEQRVKGYGTEAVRGCIDWLFQSTNASEILYVVEIDSPASIRLAKRLGLTQRADKVEDGTMFAVFVAMRPEG